MRYRCVRGLTRPQQTLVVATLLATLAASVVAEQADRDSLSTAPGNAALPVGAIIAFMPRMGSEYGNVEELRAWLRRQGWAICDGADGTPDMRNRMLLGTTDPITAGQRLGSRDHDHRVRGDTEAPLRRNRSTPTGRFQLKQIPDEQHRHRLDIESDKAEHLPPSMRVLFIIKVR